MNEGRKYAIYRVQNERTPYHHRYINQLFDTHSREKNGIAHFLMVEKKNKNYEHVQRRATCLLPFNFCHKYQRRWWRRQQKNVNTLTHNTKRCSYGDVNNSHFSIFQNQWDKSSTILPTKCKQIWIEIYGNWWLLYVVTLFVWLKLRLRYNLMRTIGISKQSIFYLLYVNRDHFVAI